MTVDPNILLVTLCTGLAALWAYVTLKRTKLMAAAPAEPQPTIIVNMPADARPLEQLAPVEVDVTVSAPRAILWYTVYKATLEHYLASGSDAGPLKAVERADSAVRTAYGPLP